MFDKSAELSKMKLFGTAIVLTGLIVITGNAQHKGYRPIADVPAFKKQFAAQSAKVSSIECAFAQEKVLTALTEKITSTGKFWFRRNNKVRIELFKV